MSSCPLQDFNSHLSRLKEKHNIPPSARPRRTVGVSLKLYFSLAKTSSYIQECLPLAAHAASQPLPVDLFIIPDLISLQSSKQLLEGTDIKLGAPDCFWEDEGAFTGEVSPKSLKELGVSIVELGHAERRRLFGETDETVALKARAVLRNNMIPLICIGETTQSTIQDALSEVQPQVESILSVLESLQESGDTHYKKREVIFAYEPVWAIGQPEPASAEWVKVVVSAMRCICTAAGRGEEIRFLYGGSAGPGTFGGLRGGVDGLFLGRFAHDVKNFWNVVAEVGSDAPEDAAEA
jgi:triosephosphate isomerase